MPKLKKEIGFRIAKIFDIGYITIIYFILSIILAKCVDSLIGTFDENKEKLKSKFRQTLELIGIMWLNVIIIYIVKNVVELIPSPFNNINGLDHMKIKELKNGTVFLFIFLLLQRNFINKLHYYYKNIFN